MPSDNVPTGDISPQSQVSRLMDGYLTTQLLYIAAKLGVADVLAGGPQASNGVAQAVGAEPDALHRALRALAAEGVLEERPDGRFGLTALGACLRSGVPGSLRGAIIARGDLYFRAAAGLLEATRGGGVAFEHAYGSSFFEYVAQHPERAAEFQASMADRSRQEAAHVVSSYDFDRFDRLVDVGGGTGILLAAILAAAPRLQGTLMDQPHVVERARERLQTDPVAARCALVGGDFFASVPSGGDVYLLSRVVHDWNDEAAARILTNCRRAMADGGTLLLVEAVLPERAQDHPAAIRMDLHMLVLATGRERTAAEFDRLLTASGFEMTRIVPTGSPAGIHVIEAVGRTTPGLGGVGG
jgi:hypothetical protein